MSKVEVEAEYVYEDRTRDPRSGDHEVAGSNTREGYTVEQPVTFVPGHHSESSMHTELYDLRKTGSSMSARDGTVSPWIYWSRSGNGLGWIASVFGVISRRLGQRKLKPVNVNPRRRRK